MADISAQPFINYGASIAGQENTAANTGLTRAQTQLTGEQASQEAMNTQVQRATMPMIMHALTEASADQSGMNPGNPVAGAGMRAGRAAGDQPDTGYAADSLEDKVRNTNYVPPVTPQEEQMLKLGTAMSLNPKTAAGGAAMIQRMQTQRQMRIETATAQNQNKMGNIYDAATAVADYADKNGGKGAWKMLEKTDPADAKAIADSSKNADGDFDEDQADFKAANYAKHLAAVSSIYNGRPLKMENGQLFDERTGQKVTGRDQLFTGLGPKELQAEYDKAREPMKWTTPDNVEHQDERWHAPIEYGGYGGKLTPAQAALTADQAARHNVNAPDGSIHPPGIVAHEAAKSGISPAHGAAAAARVNARQTAPQPTTGADIAAGKAPATGADTGTLPGVNPAQLPKVQSPTSSQGPGTGGTYGTKMTEGLAAKARTELDAANEASVNAQSMRSQIAQAKAEIPKIDPRTVGPGSTLYKGALQFYTAAAGKAPNALIDEGVLDKFLNQIGASNVRSLLAGQRITNQEMMTFLTRGSPSTSMPLGGIKHLLDYLDADNEYTLRYNRTKTMALKSGADPDLVDQELSNKVDRAGFVSRKTGHAGTLSQNGPTAKSPQEDVTEEAHGKLGHGDAFYWKGQLHHKGVD